MILSVAGVRFAYNGSPVLQDLTFDARAGEILAVLGVNGAGKSTLLKCINLILKPTKGAILVDKRDVREMGRSERSRSFGYVPQHRGEEEMVVFDAVLLGRKPHITWTANERDLEVVEQVIRDTGLEHLAMRPVNKLSGGEAQKVLIARALAQEPEILLLDEPTNALDVRNQLEIMGMLRRLTETKNLITIISIHDINLALRFTDRFLLLKDGTVHRAPEKNKLAPEDIREVYGVEMAMIEVAGCPVAVPVREIH